MERQQSQSQSLSPLRDLLVEGLKTSSVLKTQLPRVRRLALIQTLQYVVVGLERDAASANSATNNNSSSTHTHTDLKEKGRRIDDEALGIILHNVHTSPYLDKEQFQDAVLNVLVQSLSSSQSHSSSILKPQVVNAMADKILDGDWEGLQEILSRAGDETGNDTHVDVDVNIEPDISLNAVFDTNDEFTHTNNNESTSLRSFRDMVIAMLSTSRKIASLDINRRRGISKLVHSATSISEMIRVALSFLNTSVIFPETSTGGPGRGTAPAADGGGETSQRSEVEYHILKGRFDLLLLPEYFDCEEKQRRQNSISSTSILSINSNGEGAEGAGGASDSNDYDDECTICLGEFETAITLSCNHRFCIECIHKWSSSEESKNNIPSCPTCRAPIEQ